MVFCLLGASGLEKNYKFFTVGFSLYVAILCKCLWICDMCFVSYEFFVKTAPVIWCENSDDVWIIVNHWVGENCEIFTMELNVIWRCLVKFHKLWTYTLWVMNVLLNCPVVVHDSIIVLIFRSYWLVEKLWNFYYVCFMILGHFLWIFDVHFMIYEFLIELPLFS